jgi:hypothetical protein
MGAMRPQTPHRSPRQAFRGEHLKAFSELDGFEEWRLGVEGKVGIERGWIKTIFSDSD